MDEFFEKYLHNLPQPLDKERQNNLLRSYFELKKSQGKKDDEVIDCETRDLLIAHNLRLVANIAYECAKNGNGKNLDELFSAGSTALIIYLDKYDINRGVDFTTYIYYCIKGKIYEEINSNKRRKTEVLNNDPISEIECRNGESIDIFDTIEDDNFVEDVLSNEYVNYLLRCLDKKDREIVELRLGMSGKEDMGYEDIGEICGISGYTARQRYLDAISRLKELFFNQGETIDKTRLKLISEYVDGIKDERTRVAIEHIYGINGREKLLRKIVCSKFHVGSHKLCKIIKEINDYLEEMQDTSLKITKEDIEENLKIIKNQRHKIYLEHFYGLNGRKQLRLPEIEALYNLKSGSAGAVLRRFIKNVSEIKKDRVLNGIGINNLRKNEVEKYVSTLSKDSLERRVLEMMFGIECEALSVAKIASHFGEAVNGLFYNKVKQYKQNVVGFNKGLDMEKQ